MKKFLLNCENCNNNTFHQVIHKDKKNQILECSNCLQKTLTSLFKKNRGEKK